jgi:glycerol-3-phosphate dehydrogenase (NAD(P)+)
MAIFTVLGAGMMGSAWCVPLADRGHEVRLCGTHLDGAIIDSLKRNRFHPKLGVELPQGVKPYAVDEIGEAFDGCDVIGSGVSSAGVGWAIERLAPFTAAGRPVVMITKGLRWDGERLQVFPDVVGAGLAAAAGQPIVPAAIAGPCIAGELARRVPTCVVVACRDGATAGELARLMATDYYRLWPNSDVVGVEICAALKNAYAMGCAMGTGLHEKLGGAPGSVAMHNYEAAVFAQSIVEMQRVITLLGGDTASAAGLAGAGDLDVTNNGGRTGRFGRLLGLGLSQRQAVEAMQGATLECLEILAVMREAVAGYVRAGALAAHELPLLLHLCEVALDGAPLAMPFERFFGHSQGGA